MVDCKPVYLPMETGWKMAWIRVMRRQRKKEITPLVGSAAACKVVEPKEKTDKEQSRLCKNMERRKWV